MRVLWPETSVLLVLAFTLGCGDSRASLSIEDLPTNPYYMSADACHSFGIFMESGMLYNASIFERTPCGADSNVECNGGRCLLVCSRFNGSDTTALLEIQRFAYELPDWVTGDVFSVFPALKSAYSPADTTFSELARAFDSVLVNARDRTLFSLYESQADCEYERALSRRAAE